MPRPCTGHCTYDPTEAVEYCLKCYWKSYEIECAEDFLNGDLIGPFAQVLTDRRWAQKKAAPQPAATATT
jgi:hypothetical protein